jgi:SAM-dependent methyltransferase
MSSSSGPSLDQIKAGMRAQWTAGDFGMVARTIASDGERFALGLQLEPGSRVLDVACGTGNVAIPLARAGCVVTGVDIAPNLLVQARKRAAAEGMTIAFDEGDAEELPYPDGSFDVVVTMFGAMFAPRPEKVVTELARVLKPGGLLAMANWTPGSFTGAMFRVGALHVPPPAGLQPPVLWGDEATVRARLEPCFGDLQTRAISMQFNLPMSPQGAVAFFREYFGPTKMAFRRLDEAGQNALRVDLETLWAGANVAKEPGTHTLIANEYLEVRATKRS